MPPRTNGNGSRETETELQGACSLQAPATLLETAANTFNTGAASTSNPS